MSLSLEAHFFDLHTSGVGYLNRVREVTVRKGKPFMACDVQALRGDSDDVEYTRFDCKVTGGEAEKLIRKCQKAVTEKRKVLIGFRIGDIYTELFTYTSGDKNGQPGVSLKGRLLFISFIKIDGVEVYKAQPRETQSTAETVNIPDEAEQLAADDNEVGPEERSIEQDLQALGY